MSVLKNVAIAISSLLITTMAFASEPVVIDLWPGMAPGETTHSTGEMLPRRESENPPATRIRNITRPQLMLHAPPEGRRNGAAVLIFPGGAYNYVVADKEGSECAAWLNQRGITAFVVHYRTKMDGAPQQTDEALPGSSERPLQDGQRAVSLVRSRAAEWGLQSDRIGVIGFSAGGQAAALVTTRFATRAYPATDHIDTASCRPDFSLLIYPWRLVDDATGQLNAVLPLSKDTPPTFFVHTHDDGATSMSSVLMYAGLKQHRVPSELHIYATGGHGYGMRPVENSAVDTWPQRAAEWLDSRGLFRNPMADEK